MRAKTLIIAAVVVVVAAGLYAAYFVGRNLERSQEGTPLPLADVFILDYFYCKDKSRTDRENRRYLYLDLLFLDFLARPEHAHLEDQSKKMIYFVLRNEISGNEARGYLMKKFEGVIRMDSDNLVCINGNDEVVFSLIGGTNRMTKDVRGGAARGVIENLVDAFVNGIEFRQGPENDK